MHTPEHYPRHSTIRWYLNISPRHFSPSPLMLISYTIRRLDNCHESIFYLSNALLSSIPTSIRIKNVFINCKGSGLCRHYTVCTTSLLLRQEFFHQSSF